MGIASVLLGLALGSFIYSWSFARDAAQAEGRVVQLQKDESDPTCFNTVFVFRDAGGIERTVQSLFASWPPEYEVGDSVKVLYDVRSPENARMADFFSVWGLTVITASLGVFWLMAGKIILKRPLNVAQVKGNRWLSFASTVQR